MSKRSYYFLHTLLVVEVTSTSASYDLRGKLYAYQRNDIQAYLVWQIYDQQLDWFHLVEGTYKPLQPKLKRLNQIFIDR